MLFGANFDTIVLTLRKREGKEERGGGKQL